VSVNEENGHIESTDGFSERATGLAVQVVLLGDVKSSNEFELRPCERVTYDSGGTQGVSAKAAGFFVGDVGVYISIPLAPPRTLDGAEPVFSSSVALPEGMAIDASNGTVYGTPSAAAKLSEVWVETEVSGRYYGERYSLEVRDDGAGGKNAWAPYTAYAMWGSGALCWAAAAWLAAIAK
jgi:hypothetical protein